MSWANCQIGILEFFSAKTVKVRLYDAYLVTEGEVPFKDYHTRSPVFIVLISIFVKLFGPGYYSGRLLSVFASTISIYLLYKIGKELYQKEVGVISAFLFAFSPFTLKWGVTVETEVVQLPFVLLAIIFFIRALENKSMRFYFISGIVLGFAVLIRRSSLSVVLGEGIIILYLFYQKGQSNRMKRYLEGMKAYGCVIFGVFVVVFSLLTFFSILTSFSYMFNLFLNSPGIMSPTTNHHHLAIIRSLNYHLLYIFVPSLVFIVLYLQEKLARYESDNNLTLPVLSIIFLVYLCVVINFSSFLFPLFLLGVLAITIFPNSYLLQFFKDSRLVRALPFLLLLFVTITIFSNKQYSGIRNWPIIAGLIALMIILFFLESSFTWARKGSVFISLLVLPFLFFLRSGNDSSSQLEEDILILCILLATVLSLWVLKEGLIIDHKHQYSDTVTLLWLLSVFGFYLFYEMFKYIIIPDIYWYELAPVFCLMGGIALSSILKTSTRSTKELIHLFLVILLLSAATSQSMIANTESRTHMVSPETVKKVAEYIKENVAESEEIFTGCLVIAYQADRRVVFDISHPYYYREPELYLSNEYLRYPSIAEIKGYLLEKNVKYVIVDVHTNDYYFSKNPDFKQFIYENYQLEKEIDYVDILIKKI